jgi:hypothetical protein
MILRKPLPKSINRFGIGEKKLEEKGGIVILLCVIENGFVVY